LIRGSDPQRDFSTPPRALTGVSIASATTWRTKEVRAVERSDCLQTNVTGEIPFMARIYPGWEILVTKIINRVKPQPGDTGSLVRVIYSPAPHDREDPGFLTRLEERMCRF
jgi:hypothetical protein